MKTFYEKNNAPKFVLIDNSEDPKEAGKDISNNFEQIGFNDAFVNKGTLEMVEFSDKNSTIKLKGDIIFTKEGYLSFGAPINFLLDAYGINNTGVYVSPAYVKYQVETNKKMGTSYFHYCSWYIFIFIFCFRN